MTNVYLYGELRNLFGHEFKFNVSCGKEVLLAINANRRGFGDAIKKLAAKGVHYRIIVDDDVVKTKEELEITKAPKEVHIVPIVWGAGKNGVLIAVGVLAIIFTAGAAGAFAGALGSTGALGGAVGSTAAAAAGGATTFTALGSAMMGLGISLVLQGVMGALFPPPKPDFNQEVQAGGKSYLFGNKPNNTSQGQAVPVGYGRLKIGASQISAGMSHHSLNIDVKQLMTPVDKPINDYTSLEFVNEAPDSTDGLIQDSFSTNQASDTNDIVSFASANIINSYIDIVSKNAYKVTTGPVEVVVKRDGEIVSNVNLDTFDEDIEYEWSLSNDETTARQNIIPKIRIEYPYAFQSGLVYRSYHPVDFTHVADYVNIPSSSSNYFVKYPSGTFVKYGQNQFSNLVISNWDSSYGYNSGEIVNYPTGTETNTYFQSITAFTGPENNPTGNDYLVRATHWRKILRPVTERIYRAEKDLSGHLPTIDGTNANSAFWSGLFTPTISPNEKVQFDELISGMPSFKNEGVYRGVVEALNEQRALGSSTSVDNYAMELMGYFYVPVVENLKRQVPDATDGVMYEIIKVGDTGQWSGIGLTGVNGSAIPPKRGVTFTKNSTQSAGDGIVYPVVKYNFKIDSDDAADLYIDGQLASSWYGKHGFISPSTPEAIAAMPSTSGEILLTAGYHHLYARFQDNLGSDGISLYYQRDTNWDGTYGNFAVIPETALKHRQISDTNVPEDQKFMPRSYQIPVSQMVSGKQYKILNLGTTTNWTSFGASSPRIGTVFTKTNNTAANGNGFVFEDIYNYAESRASEGNRVVQFSAERPKINKNIDRGYSSYDAKFNCKVKLDGITLTTSPVRVKIKMLETDLPFNGLRSASLPVQNYNT